MINIDDICISTIRGLAIDQVEKAKSGHPGLPLGAAPMAYALWDRFLRHNPKNPKWFNRDRFILSAGHGSALLYSLLHLYGYDLPLEELKNFRQWGSRTPGHPEHGLVPGVEATTGPLGQGFAMGVGMAISENFLAGCFNQDDLDIVDHYTYAIVSDGDLMEGISSEAASLAGTLHLGKLIYLYDDNEISIEGDTDLAFNEDVHRRFEAYGWQVLMVQDGNDLHSIEKAIKKAQAEKQKPSLIIIRTHIGFGSPKQDTAQVHGEPLGPEAHRETKKALGLPPDELFHISEDTLSHFRTSLQKGEAIEKEWNGILENYRNRYPEIAGEFEEIIRNELPHDWERGLISFSPDEGPIATRAASGKVLNSLARRMPHLLVGGSADLAPSTKTILMGYGDFGFGKYCSNNLHFGVREHSMGAIANGMALHGGSIPYTATFLVFSDYMRPALRLSAIMQTHVVFVFTHDSIGLGEDGPTHQPVEHIMGLRLIPGMTVFRPGDANETAVGWKIALLRKGPVCLALSRQKLPVLDLKKHPVHEGASKGAYILEEAESGKPDIVIIATGAEVHLALEARKGLLKNKIDARVVSMPSWEIFDEQPREYRNEVLPETLPKLAIEAGSTLGWHKYIGDDGDVIGLDRFGASAPGKIVLENLGFNLENVAERSLKLIRRRK